MRSASRAWYRLEHGSLQRHECSADKAVFLSRRIESLRFPLPIKKDRSHTSYVSAPDFRDWHDRSRSFQTMAYYKAEETAVTVGSVAHYAHVARVSPEFFHVFGTEPLAGRTFTPEDTQPGSGAEGASA